MTRRRNKDKKKFKIFASPPSLQERLNGSRPLTSTIQPLAGRSPLFNWRRADDCGIPPSPPPAATVTTPKGFHSSSLFFGGGGGGCNLCLVWRSASWAIPVFGSFFSYLAGPNFIWFCFCFWFLCLRFTSKLIGQIVLILPFSSASFYCFSWGRFFPDLGIVFGWFPCASVIHV